MPEIVSCPACNRRLRVPDNLLGKTVKCPDCKEPFVAQVGGDEPNEDVTGAAPPRGTSSEQVSTGRSASGPERAPVRRSADDAEDDDHPSRSRGDEDETEYDDDRPRPRGLAKKEGWAKARLGLHLFIIGIYVAWGCLVVGLLIMVLAIALGAAGGASLLNSITAGGPNAGSGAAGGGATMGGALILLFVGYGLMLLGYLIQYVMQTVGQVFLLWIPEKRGTSQRPLAIASLSLWSAQLLLTFTYIGLMCMGSGMRNPNAGSPLVMSGSCANLIGGLCGLAWFFVFVFLLRSIATAMRNDALATRLITFMITVPVFGVLAFITFFFVLCAGGAMTANFASSTNSGQNAATAGIGFLVAIAVIYGLIVLIGLGLYVWYIVLLHQVRGAIDARLSRG